MARLYHPFFILVASALLLACMLKRWTAPPGTDTGTGTGILPVLSHNVNRMKHVVPVLRTVTTSEDQITPPIIHNLQPLRVLQQAAGTSQVPPLVFHPRPKLSSANTTVITAYYKMKSKHGENEYDNWIKNFMQMNFNVVIFGDAMSVSYLRKSHPETSRRRYIIREMDELETSKKWHDWDADYALDPEKKVGHNTMLYRIWNGKIFMVAEIVESNPFGSIAFAWVDIGCFRSADYPSWSPGFPDPNRFDLGKVTMLQMAPFEQKERLHVDKVDKRFEAVDRIGATMFVGTRQPLLRLRDLYEGIITEFKSHQLFSGKDQSLYAFAVLRHPELIQVIHVDQLELPRGFDRWFSLQYQFRALPPSPFAVVTYLNTSQQAEHANAFLQSLERHNHNGNINIHYIALLVNGNLKNDQMYALTPKWSKCFVDPNTAHNLHLANLWWFDRYQRVLFFDAQYPLTVIGDASELFDVVNTNQQLLVGHPQTTSSSVSKNDSEGSVVAHVVFIAFLKPRMGEYEALLRTLAMQQQHEASTAGGIPHLQIGRQIKAIKTELPHVEHHKIANSSIFHLS